MSAERVPTERFTFGNYSRLPWVPVESSNIARVAYEIDEDTDEMGTLYVEFGPGRAYRYFEVPSHEFESLLAAPSVGSYFAECIREEYATTRLLIS